MTPAARRAKKRRRHGAPMATVTEDTQPLLPVNAFADRIARALNTADVLVLVGETGSGKTTQLPQQILGRNPHARIVVTQPRRVAAMSVAARVAWERGVDVGGEVGYAVRFDEKTSVGTRIRYVTDGVLLRERDDAWSRYSHVVVDEVHERSVNTDLVLGAARGALQRKKSFKLVAASATTDAERLKKFFESGALSVAIIQVPGRLYKVNVMYTRTPVSDYVDAAATAALQVHVDYSWPGDVLVFLPGQDDLFAAAALLRERIDRVLPSHAKNDIRIHTLYAALPAAEQVKAITPLPEGVKARKVVFATNVAETSITIPGVRYVVDSGVHKLRALLPIAGMYADGLRVAPISKAQAEQRAGRAGRTEDGVVFRLYTVEAAKQMKGFPTPEMLRVDPAPALLQIAAAGGGRPEALKKFPFVDAPSKRAMQRGLQGLVLLGAFDENMALTETGKVMSGLPVTPKLARSLLESVRLGCVEMMCAAAAMLSVEGTVFMAPKDKREAAKAAHRRFVSLRGDTMSMVRVLAEYLSVHGETRKKEFCREYFVNQRALEAAANVRSQLLEICARDEVVLHARVMRPLHVETDDSEELLARCIVAGYFRNVACVRPDGKYELVGVEGDTKVAVEIHPSSVLRGKRPRWIVFDELVMTTKPYLRNVVTVKQEWLASHSEGYFRKRDT